MNKNPTAQERSDDVIAEDTICVKAALRRPWRCRLRKSVLRVLAERHPAMADSCTTEGRIRAKVRMIVADETRFGVLSSDERIAVAHVLDRYDLLQRAWGRIAESIHRLGPEWTDAALRVQQRLVSASAYRPATH